MATERSEQQQGEHVVGGTTSAATTTVTANDGDVTATSKDIEIGLSHIQEDGNDPGLPSRFLYLIVFSFGIAVLGTAGLGTLLSGDDVHGIDMSHTVLLIVGVVNSMIGSFLSAAGYCCQKQAHLRTPYTGKPGTKQGIYWIGLLLLALGTISAVANLGILGQTVQAPFAALTLIYNALLAHAILKETC